MVGLSGLASVAALQILNVHGPLAIEEILVSESRD